MKKVTVKDLVEKFDFEVICGADYLDREIITSDISRPGLEITGYFNYYPSERVQLFGRAEHTYLSRMTSDERLLIMRRLSKEDTPFFIFSRGLQPEYEVIQAAEENHIPVLISTTTTTRLSSNLAEMLHAHLAERISKHGVFVDVYGLGIMITGHSGVGKSETALELVKGGHRLVADDRVDFYQRDDTTIMGEAPEILRNVMEIRGLGIIDVMTLYGAGAVRKEQQLNLIIDLKDLKKDAKFDRLGTAEEREQILEVAIPKITIPVQTGRNISSIIEVAAINFRAKSMGFDAAQMFNDRLTTLIDKNKL
ncbi:HPr(Ser) kinase/phosphatase [Aerococcus viridans]|uniref:HPr kinase/phosphorylase n=1 Tax=Aerococcus viridans TaxID=1377 RepID=A0A2J9PMY1_9LACT|nr:HPr(Ser) kinase/phosphatase [Aerococcus viridans]MCT1797665.1 HPr(Ser) kinase/phosphatase [Aerococcus viridans]PNL91646.1 HPr kinase/phosphorylase [Aerococcus viridans]